MKKFIAILLFICATFQIAVGQEVIDKKFYKSKYGGPAVNEKDAKVVELTIKENDGTLKYELRSLSNNKLLRLSSFKDGSPVGKWISSNGKELDYEFDLPYIENESDSLNCFNLNKDNTNSLSDIEWPIFIYENNNFRAFVAKQLIYPEICVENGIQGKILYQFVIDENGKLKDIFVIESADKILDKEAARVIRQSPDWTPAKKEGKPISICVKMQIVFQLQ